LVNCRILPGETPEEVRQTIIRVLADDQISVTAPRNAAPSPASPVNGELLAAVEKLTQEFWPGTPVIPTMVTGATDGRYLRNTGIPTYGVDGLGTDLFDVRAHGRDERMPVKSFYEGIEFSYRLVKALSGGR
jgi:acetylornithine deacetylase/succinyl-diaminopimelate desuccinylase-like protein